MFLSFFDLSSEPRLPHQAPLRDAVDTAVQESVTSVNLLNSRIRFEQNTFVARTLATLASSVQISAQLSQHLFHLVVHTRKLPRQSWTQCFCSSIAINVLPTILQRRRTRILCPCSPCMTKLCWYLPSSLVTPCSRLSPLQLYSDASSGILNRAILSESNFSCGKLL